MGKKLSVWKASSRAVQRVTRRFRRVPSFRAKFYYAQYLKQNLGIDTDKALFQSFDGTNFGGNPYYILEQLHKQRPDIQYYVAVNESAVETTERRLAKHDMADVTVVAIHSRDYCRLLCSVKYLVNNATFPTYFIKRESQVYLNTWHGTPLKTMGRRMSDRPHTTGNTQRNFLMADWLLYPNEYSFEHFTEDYMLRPYYSGTYVLGGYPCNSIFFDDDRKQSTKEELGIADKKVVVFMPTWRQAQRGGHPSRHFKMLEYFLMYMDEAFGDDVVVYAKPHYYDARKRVNFSQYKKVRGFPAEYEQYEILNCADVLITDYSSVMFDFLNTGKPIVLFSYDEEEYFSSRGTYIGLDEMPFYRSGAPEEVVRKVNEYLEESFTIEEYAEIRSKMCTYDSVDASATACDLLLKGTSKKTVSIPGETYHNGKKNILIYAGALTQNGLTTSLLGLLDNADLSKANFLITFYTTKGAKAQDLISGFSDEIGYLPIQGTMPMTYPEAVARFLYYRWNITSNWVTSRIRDVYQREAKRNFCGIHFDSVIHYTGYEKSIVHLLDNCDAKQRIIYMHNDMIAERKARDNWHVPSILHAYKHFNKVAVVREGLDITAVENFGIDSSKVKVVHNLNRIEHIREQADMPLRFDDDTVSNVDFDKVVELVDNKSLVKFVDVARYSVQKGINQLIMSYKRVLAEHPNSCLFVIGGHGPEYDDLVRLAGEVSEDRVVLIRSMSNPFPIVAASNAFVLSSHYEGLPMSVMEALILGKPVISTNISGPSEFLSQGYGYLVDDSEQGLYDGMTAFIRGDLKDLKSFEPYEFNQQALNEFYQLVDID